MSWKQKVKFGVIGLIVPFMIPATALAAQSASTNYQVNEVFFGAGGALNNCSTNYCAKESAGETAVGNSSSTNYLAHAGFNTDRYPSLQFIVNGTNTDVGGLSTGLTTTTTATFSVKTYLSSGYQVVTVSPPPKNNAYTMQAMTTQTTSHAGNEQFGMNLVANPSSNPSCAGIVGLSGTLGSGTAQVPSSAFSFGVAGNGSNSDYNTACQFKYNQGDTIASSAKSSGETDYTISYIYNISVVTPGGAYTFNDVLVATATF
jgi:hypothetical protein